MVMIGTRRTIYELRLYNLSDGVHSANVQIYNTTLAPVGAVLHGVETDGESAYTLHNQGGNDIIRKYLLSGAGDTFTLDDSATPLNNNLIDRCYDGDWWWGLFSGNFRKFEDWKFSQNFGDTQSHGLSGVQGIMFTGEKIGILAT